jgi:hypothetical protein
MIDKMKLYSEAIDSSILWKSEASLAYNTFYMKIIGYGTPATSLSYQECDDMQKPAVNSILPKTGIHWKAARAVVFGTAQHGGSDLTTSQQSSSAENSNTSGGAFDATTRQVN